MKKVNDLDKDFEEHYGSAIKSLGICNQKIDCSSQLTSVSKISKYLKFLATLTCGASARLEFNFCEKVTP